MEKCVWFSLCLLICSAAWTAKAQVTPQNSNDWITISNSAQCAAEQSRPARSVFIAASLRDYSLVVSNTAQSLNKPSQQFVAEGNLVFRKKLVRISQDILNGLASGQLPFVTQNNSELIKQNVAEFRKKAAPTMIATCQQVNQINGYYSNLFIRGIKASTLEHLARQFMDPKNTPAGCNDSQLVANADFYPVFNFEIPQDKWTSLEPQGFEFWASFKIYLSWMWRQEIEKDKSPFIPLMKALPIEEQVVLMPNGCRSLAKPQCGSEFLSTAELRTLLVTERTFPELTNSSLDMRDQIFENNDKQDFSVQSRLADESENNQWIRTFQKNYLAFSQTQQERLFQANKLMSRILSTKGEKTFTEDLIQSVAQVDQSEMAYYLCSEYRILETEKPTSLFKTDYEFLKKEGHRLNRFMNYGLTVEQMLEFFEKLSPTLEKVCGQFDERVQKDRAQYSKLLSFKPWYRQYLSRYKIFKAEMAAEAEEEKMNPTAKAQVNESSYVSQICSDPIECTRQVLESVIYINKSLLHSKTLFRDEIPQVPLFSERSEKVACGMYDPWEASRLNRKKLITDIGTSLLFGWTSVPIYLDINYKPKELVSLNKLIENGQVKFDTQFKSGEIQKTLTLSLGSFINVPCSVQISQVNATEPKAPLVFNGISVGACKSVKFNELTPIDKKVDTFRKNPKTDISTCGQCSLSFSEAASFSAATVFSPVRFFIRLAESIFRYKKVQNDDVINPRQFNINKDALIETYKRYENSIPESCTNILTRGLSCMGNLCESLTARDFELKSGLKVDQVSLVPQLDRPQDEYLAAIKVKGCSREILTQVRCSPDGDNFFMSYYSRLAKSCQKQEGLK